MARSHFDDRCESLALGYLAASLRSAGIEVNILDSILQGLSPSDTVDKILEESYSLIGFTIPDPTVLEPTLWVIDQLRAGGVKAHITMGGHTPTFHYREVLESCGGLDSVVRHEGENAIIELAERVGSGEKYEGVRNLAYRMDGHVMANKVSPLVSVLDRLPFPARDTLPFLLNGDEDCRVAAISGGRGCYKDCSFCSIRAFYEVPESRSWRVRSAESITGEMLWLNETYNIDEVIFVDDIFIGHGKAARDRVTAFCDAVNKSGLAMMFSISESVENVNRDLFAQLRAVGLRQVLLGVESADQETLNYFNKRTTVQQIHDAITTLQDLDLDVTISFINFTPQSDIDKILGNVAFFSGFGVNVLQGMLNRLQIYGGTPLAERCMELRAVKGTDGGWHYSSRDPKADILFSISRESLGTYLEASCHLKRIERRLRRRLFRAEVTADVQALQCAVRERLDYRMLLATITGEAVDLFSDIAEAVRAVDPKDTVGIEKIKREARASSLRAFKGWVTLIRLYDIDGEARILQEGR